MGIEQYKKSIVAACELYQKEISQQAKSIHPARMKDLNVFYELMQQIDEKVLLNLKLKEYLAQMSTRGRIWSLYMLSTGDSRLKYLINEIITFYDSDHEYEYLRKSLSSYESELEKKDLIHKQMIKSIEKDHTLLMDLKEKQHQSEIERLKKQIDFLLEENTTLKEMLAKQSNIIKGQLEQMMSYQLSCSEIKVMAADQALLASEVAALNSVSIFPS